MTVPTSHLTSNYSTRTHDEVVYHFTWRPLTNTHLHSYLHTHKQQMMMHLIYHAATCIVCCYRRAALVWHVACNFRKLVTLALQPCKYFSTGTAIFAYAIVSTSKCMQARRLCVCVCQWAPVHWSKFVFNSRRASVCVCSLFVYAVCLHTYTHINCGIFFRETCKCDLITTFIHTQAHT